MPSTEVMSKWASGQLHSGSKSGPVVPKTKKGQKRAVAIMLSEKRKEDANGGTYPDPDEGRQRMKKPTRRGS